MIQSMIFLPKFAEICRNLPANPKNLPILSTKKYHGKMESLIALQGDLNLACKSNVDHFSQLFSMSAFICQLENPQMEEKNGEFSNQKWRNSPIEMENSPFFLSNWGFSNWQMNALNIYKTRKDWILGNGLFALLKFFSWPSIF